MSSVLKYTIFHSKEDDGWICYRKGYPELSAFGDTTEEAIDEAKSVWMMAQEFFLEHGIEYKREDQLFDDYE